MKIATWNIERPKKTSKKNSMIIDCLQKLDADILRVHLVKGSAKLKEDCDIMIDQIRAIDNKRLLKKIGELSQQEIEFIKINLSIILDI